MLKRWLPALTATLISAGLAADLPDLGEQSQSILSPQQEQSIGENAMRELRFSKEWLGDTEINEYLGQLMNRIVSSNPEIRQSFQPVALADNSINAFAIPGGVVGVHTGLISAASNESELAAVLAHEMAHVTQHHTARMIASQQKSVWPTLAMLAAILVASRTNGNNQAIEAGIVSAQAYSIQDQLDYTRNHEREADRIGMQFLKQAGFDPRAMPRFFEKLQQANRLQESNAPAFLRTHPITPSRIADAQGRLNNEPYRQYLNSPDFLYMQEKSRALTLPNTQLEAEYKNRQINSANDSYRLIAYGQAWLYLRNHQPQKAKTLLTTLMAAPKNRYMGHLTACILAANGDTQEAISILKTLQQNATQSIAIQEEIIGIYLEANHPELALQELNALNASHTDWPEAYELKAKALNQLGRETDSHIALADFYLELGATSEAIRQLNIAKDTVQATKEQKEAIEARLKSISTNKPER